MDEHIENDFGELLQVVDPKDSNVRWTPKQRRFVYHMARTAQVKDSAKRAGFSDPDYGSQLMAKPHIQRAIALELRNVLNAEQENEESVIARWSNWANCDIGDYFDAGWQIKDVASLDEPQRKRIKKITVKEHQHGRDVNIELHDAHKANNDLATFLGMLGKQDGSSDAPDELARFIKGCLQEMDAVDAIQSEDSGGGPGDSGPTTH